MGSNFLYGKIEQQLSSIRLFPGEEIAAGYSRYFIYLELRNAQNQYVDFDLNEISLRTAAKVEIHFKVDRLSRGRYYLIIEASDELASKKLDLSINDQTFYRNFTLFFLRPDPRTSFIHIVESGNNSMKMKLFLSDSNGSPVELPGDPELIIEGQALIEGVKRIKKGVWEFELIYPERNEIFYISVRANGVNLRHMFRMHYVQK
jgi:hypothetical protein